MNPQYRIDESSPEFQEMLREVEAMNLKKADGKRFDAGETAVITRQLVYVKAKTKDIKYPMFKARMFIPVSHDVPSGAETWEYHQWDMFGMAKIVTNYATDFPKVDALKKKFSQNIKSLGDAYGYTVQDLRRAAMAGAQGGSLDSKRASMARRAIEAAIDDIAAVGNPDAGFTGFVNNANVPVVANPGPVWASATALEMIADLNFVVQTVITQSNEVEIPDTILLPTLSFQQASQTPYSTLADRTVLSWFLANNPYIQNVDQWIKLNLANAGGTAGRVVCYRRDPEALTLEIPQEFEQFAPQLEGMEYSIPCHARIGGCVFFYPLSAAYMDGTS